MIFATIIDSNVDLHLQKAMDDSGESNFLLDGFPRNDENLTGWNASSLAEKVLQIEIWEGVSIAAPEKQNFKKSFPNLT